MPPQTGAPDLWARAEQILRDDKHNSKLLQKAIKIIEDRGLILPDEASASAHRQLCGFLDSQVNDLKQKESHDKVAKVIQTLMPLKEMVNTVASVSPPASMACAAVTLGFQLAIQAIEHESTLFQGLEKIPGLICRIHAYTGLYLQNMNPSDDITAKLEQTLQSLANKIIEYEVRTLCYLGKSSFAKTMRNMVRHDSWESLHLDFNRLEEESTKFITIINSKKIDASSKDQETLQKTKHDKTRDDFLRALYVCLYEENKDRNRRRIPGTCKWFTQHPIFQKWINGVDPTPLLVTAEPGCGKSVLAKYLVDDVILTTKERTVCYFFFKDDSEDQKASSIALASLLRQVFQARPDSIPESALIKFKQDGLKLPTSFKNLWDIFMEVCSNPNSGEIVFVIDALDECQENDRLQLIRAITGLYTRNKRHNLRVLITSRPYEQIRRAFWELENRYSTSEKGDSTIHLSSENGKEGSQISAEIDLVIQSRVREISSAKRLGVKEQEQFQNHFRTKNAQRTYLWVALVMDFIQESPGFTGADTRRALTRLPTNVNDAYEKILRRSPNPDKARKILHVVIAANRPLQLQELSLALAVNTLNQSDEETQDEMEPAERFKYTARELCGHLLTIIDNKVYLLHQTLKEFLVCDPSLPRQISTPGIWHHSFEATESHSILAKPCIYVLCSKRGTCHESLRGYSVLHWSFHLCKSSYSKSENITTLAKSLCGLESKESRAWYDDYSKMDFFRWHSSLAEASPLNIASSFGLWAVVAQMLESDHDIESKNLHGSSSLALAARYGHEAVVRLLVRHGADLGSRLDCHTTPLWEAVDHRHEAVVRSLLESGADVNQGGKFGRFPLHSAASNGSIGILNMLLRAGADIHRSDSSGLAISAAAGYGHSAIVELLIQAGSEIDGRNSLARAAFDGDKDTVEILLRAGAGINVRGRLNKTPLEHAAEEGHTSLVERFIEAGAEIGTERSLSKAAEGGYERIVKILLQAGAAINAKDRENRSPLSRAAENGHVNIVKILLQAGADTHHKDPVFKGKGGQTPLHRAAENGHLAVLKLLLQFGADITARDHRKRTALFWAAKRGHLAVMEFLLGAGESQVDVKDEDGRSPLSWAGELNHEGVVKLLIQTPGVDVDSRDQDGRSPLWWASIQGRRSVVEMLLETKKVEVASKDIRGQTPLDMTMGRYKEVGRLLVAHGA